MSRRPCSAPRMPLAMAAGVLFATPWLVSPSELSLDPAALQLPQRDAAELRQAIVSNSWGIAERILFEAATEKPADALIQRALGIAHYQAGHYLPAASALMRADASAPLEPQARFLLASSFIKLERRHWARAELETLITNHNDTGQYRHTLARVYYDQQRFQDAATLLREVIQKDPGSADSYDLLGQCLEALGEFEGAEAAFRRAISLNKGQARDDPWPHFHLGSLLHDLGDIEGATGALRNAVKADDRNVPAHLELGVALKKLNKLNAAVTVLEKTVWLAPADARIYFTLGDVYRRLGWSERAHAAMMRFRELSKIRR